MDRNQPTMASSATITRLWISGTIAQLSDANFRVRLINVSNNTARDFRLDGVEVQVNYTP